MKANSGFYGLVFSLMIFAGAAVCAQDKTSPGIPPVVFGSSRFWKWRRWSDWRWRPRATSVFDTPELSGKLRVSNTGDIILPLGGLLHVAGLKAEEATI